MKALFVFFVLLCVLMIITGCNVPSPLDSKSTILTSSSTVSLMSIGAYVGWKSQTSGSENNLNGVWGTSSSEHFLRLEPMARFYILMAITGLP